MDKKVLLTIAIPTFNREGYLDLCLGHICKQVSGHESTLELLVSDNHSTDNTPAIVQKYIDQGFGIRYIRNEVNIGADRNFIQCFKEAKGKYLLIFGDDDLLLDGALAKIMEVLQDAEYGVVHLRAYAFSTDFVKEMPKQTPKRKRLAVYSDPDDFVEKVNYWFTFISGNVINKSLVEGKVDFERFSDTNLIQLSWTFPALLSAGKNAVINEYVIAGKNDNSGGYQFFKVFCTNLNKVMAVLSKEGLSRAAIASVNSSLLQIVFPFFILKLRGPGDSFEKEDFFSTLHHVYKKNVLFWLYIYPLIKLPLPLAKMWLVLIRVINKLKRIVTEV